MSNSKDMSYLVKVCILIIIVNTLITIALFIAFPEVSKILLIIKVIAGNICALIISQETDTDNKDANSFTTVILLPVVMFILLVFIATF